MPTETTKPPILLVTDRMVQAAQVAHAKAMWISKNQTEQMRAAIIAALREIDNE